MKSIASYIFKKQVYRKYISRDQELVSLISFNGLGWLALLALLALLAFFLFAFTNAYSGKNDVKPEQISKGTVLRVNKWKHFLYDELPIYQWKQNTFLRTPNEPPEILDTVFYELQAIKIDSTILGQEIGIAQGPIIKNKKGIFVEFDKKRNIKTVKAHWNSFSESKDFSKTKYVLIDDIMLEDTKPPEGWFFFFLIGLLSLYFCIKTIQHFFRFFKTRAPVMGSVATHKTDRRFKSGQRKTGSVPVVVDYKYMDSEDIPVHRAQQGTRFFFFAFWLGLCAWILQGLWLS